MPFARPIAPVSVTSDPSPVSPFPLLPLLRSHPDPLNLCSARNDLLRRQARAALPLVARGPGATNKPLTTPLLPLFITLLISHLITLERTPLIALKLYFGNAQPAFPAVSGLSFSAPFPSAHAFHTCHPRTYLGYPLTEILIWVPPCGCAAVRAGAFDPRGGDAQPTQAGGGVRPRVGAAAHHPPGARARTFTHPSSLCRRSRGVFRPVSARR